MTQVYSVSLLFTKHTFPTFQIPREEVLANLARMQAVGSSPRPVKPVPASLNLNVKETVYKSEPTLFMILSISATPMVSRLTLFAVTW